ncbi:MAG TPA: DUF6651 domain-containing protein [Methylosinus sp.]|jgi:hypothetical protein|uniref:DUF6651 domain-containing protein n=1 Tax=Methylosinus sp. TaxID=427 RepID=UPI002F921458
MKLKTIEKDGVTYAEVKEGKPVYVNDDGSEAAVDLPGTAATISRLNGEAKTHREAKESALEKLKAFEGIDPAAARDALDKLANIDAKKLIDAGEVEKVKEGISRALEGKMAEAKKAYEQTIAEERAKSEKLESSLHAEKIGGAFARSQFIKDKLVIPPDLVQARFGKNFKLEDGKVIAYDDAGQQIYSPARPGQLADFDEALSSIVGSYPQKDHILKGSGASGTGARQSAGNGGNGAKTIRRAEFFALSPADQASKIKSGHTVVDE